MRMGNLPFLLLLCAALSCAFPANTRQTKEEGMQLIQVRKVELWGEVWLLLSTHGSLCN